MKAQQTELAEYPGLYSISEDGSIFSIRKMVAVTPHRTKRGYLQVSLYRGGVRKKHYVHRLVAQTFIPNPENLPEVNHEDGIKENCHKSNLTWSSHAGNMAHATKLGLISSASGFHGVFRSSKNSWKVELSVNGVLTYVGSYPDAILAARAYNKFVTENGLPHVLNPLDTPGEV